MIGVGLICVEEPHQGYYKERTLRAIDYWSKLYQVSVLTNAPDFFLYKKCKVFPYTPTKFNFHDKLTFLGELTKDYELSVLVDVNKLPDKDEHVHFKENDFAPGLHSPDYWEVDWKILNKLPLVDNKISYWQRWDDELGISKMENVPIPICERILVLRRHPQFTQYFELIEKKYKRIATENDRFMNTFDPNKNDTAEGRGEGFSFALAAAELGFPVICPSFPLYLLKNDLKRQYL